MSEARPERKPQEPRSANGQWHATPEYRARLKAALVELCDLDDVRFSTVYDIARKYKVFRSDLASAYGNPANWPLDSEDKSVQI